MNRTTLIGKLGKDHEMRYTQNGIPACNFSVATNKKVKGQDQVQWHQCVAWGKLGELCNQYLKKGHLVGVEGELEYTKYTDKNGIERRVTNIVCRDVEFLEKKPMDQAFETIDKIKAMDKKVEDNSAFGGTNFNSPPKAASAPANDGILFNMDDIEF